MRPDATAMIWKLLQVAAKSFCPSEGHWLLPAVQSGKTLLDGVMKRKSKVFERMAAQMPFTQPLTH